MQISSHLLPVLLLYHLSLSGSQIRVGPNHFSVNEFFFFFLV
ncbi:hypothetical protein GLYMA_08G311101v4 [Glycine max]|nr:hypothetical protein GLYMA_08G311101v4 [Glycine max]KAH1053999.1 hypothetical protein GYH30_022984 [Glycine max]